MMGSIGKALVLFGVVLITVGVLVQLFQKVPWIGRLPGDIYIKRENISFYFPLATSLLISLILTLLLNLFGRK